LKFGGEYFIEPRFAGVKNGQARHLKKIGNEFSIFVASEE
jgi:hypothetical protein